MRLTKKVKTGTKTKYYFEEYLRDDFVSRGLLITLRDDGSISSLSFNSATFGTMSYEAERGLVSCFGWDTEEKIDSLSYISKHYRSHFHSTTFNADLASLIYFDIHQYLSGEELKNAIKRFVEEKNRLVQLKLTHLKIETKQVIKRPFVVQQPANEKKTPETIKPAFNLRTRNQYRTCSACYQSIFISETTCKHCGSLQPKYRLPLTLSKLFVGLSLGFSVLVFILIVLLIQLSLVSEAFK